jgi:hypothetical protein
MLATFLLSTFHFHANVSTGKIVQRRRSCEAAPKRSAQFTVDDLRNNTFCTSWSAVLAVLRLYALASDKGGQFRIIFGSFCQHHKCKSYPCHTGDAQLSASLWTERPCSSYQKHPHCTRSFTPE